MAIEQRNIPGTDLSVSLLGFGNFTFGVNWWIDATDEEAVAIQNAAFDLGVTFFDTAPAYGNWRAEKLLKPTIAYAGRDNVVVSTKFGYDLVSDPGEEGSHRERKQDFSRKAILAECERSLENMGIDCIDLYQAHNIRHHHYNDELLGTMDLLKQQGKIRYWGVALGPAIGWREEGHEGLLKYGAATAQTVYNMYEQDLGRELGEICEHLGRGGVISRVPTNSGMLDDEFKSPDHKFDINDHRKFRDRNWLIYGLKKNEMVRPMAQELGLNLRQFAMRWLASQPGMVSIEPNILSVEDVKDYAIGCTGEPLPQSMLDQIAEWYADDFGLGEDAHPCDHKSSFAPNGQVRSQYIAPALGAAS